MAPVHANTSKRQHSRTRYFSRLVGASAGEVQPFLNLTRFFRNDVDRRSIREVERHGTGRAGGWRWRKAPNGLSEIAMKERPYYERLIFQYAITPEPTRSSVDAGWQTS
jgi:hypothetical protein